LGTPLYKLYLSNQTTSQKGTLIKQQQQIFNLKLNCPILIKKKSIYLSTMVNFFLHLNQENLLNFNFLIVEKQLNYFLTIFVKRLYQSVPYFLIKADFKNL